MESVLCIDFLQLYSDSGNCLLWYFSEPPVPYEHPSFLRCPVCEGGVDDHRIKQTREPVKMSAEVRCPIATSQNNRLLRNIFSCNVAKCRFSSLYFPCLQRLLQHLRQTVLVHNAVLKARSILNTFSSYKGDRLSA